MTEQVTGAVEISDTSLVDTFAREYGMNGRKMYETLAATIFPSKQSATIEQVNALLIVARAYKLNPWSKEIYAFPSKGGGIVPIVSVDGWLKLATTHPQCAGLEVTVEMGPDGKTPVSATCRVHRHDWKVPFELTEYFHEVKRGTEPWRNQPVRMMRHRATIQAVRVAFGFGGIYEADEAARRPDVIAPPEYRESEIVRQDPLSVELHKNTADGAAAHPREAVIGEKEMAESAPARERSSEVGATSPHAKAIGAFVALGVGSNVIEAEIAHQEGEGHSVEDVTVWLRALHKAVKADGPRALITRLRSEKACDLLDRVLDPLDVAPKPADAAALAAAGKDLFGEEPAHDEP